MVTLLVVLVGFSIILGKDDLAKRLVQVMVGLVLVLSFLPGLLARNEGDPTAFGCAALDATTDTALTIVLVVFLAGVGATLWRMRALIAKHREGEAKRWSAPRDRVAPPPPSDDNIDEGEAR